MTARAKDITGQRFGRLTVVVPAGYGPKRQLLWLCRCDCGREIRTRGTALRYGTTKSCGCLQRDQIRKSTTTHGLSGGRGGTRLYRIWRNLKQRCLNPKASKYALYGGRGIRVCDEWRDSYAAFHAWAMAHGYREELSLDRTDGSGNYEPGNCRWATFSEQARNTRRNRLLTYHGETKPLIAWTEDLSLNERTVRQRLDRYGWSVERALSTRTERRAP